MRNHNYEGLNDAQYVHVDYLLWLLGEVKEERRMLPPSDEDFGIITVRYR
jgi:hypothetical protein